MCLNHWNILFYFKELVTTLATLVHYVKSTIALLTHFWRVARRLNAHTMRTPMSRYDNALRFESLENFNFLLKKKVKNTGLHILMLKSRWMLIIIGMQLKHHQKRSFCHKKPMVFSSTKILSIYTRPCPLSQGTIFELVQAIDMINVLEKKTLIKLISTDTHTHTVKR